MLIEIVEYVPQTKIIDVVLPYYYRVTGIDEGNICNVIGKIEAEQITWIEELHSSASTSFEIMIKKHADIKSADIEEYFDDEHKATKFDFETIQKSAVQFLGSLIT